MSNKNFLMVSDGTTTWTYLPAQREYSEVSAAPLLLEGWRFCPNQNCSGWDYAWIFAHALPRTHGATLRGEQSLTVGGQQIVCYVISVPVSYRVGPLKPTAAAETLWVDKSRFIVWRDAFEGGLVPPVANGSPNGIIGDKTYLLGALHPGPVREDAFHFDPPAGARRVESLSRDNGVYPWWHLHESDPPEASLNRDGIGFKAPDFALRDLNGKNFRLRDLRGKVVVLDFWASWCKPCLTELAAVQKLHDELASNGVVFLGIDDESPETIRAFVKARGYTFPMLLDAEQKVHQLYCVHYAPFTAVINRKGKIADEYIGAGGEAQLLKALKKAGLKLPVASVRH